jgi:hypothetical protein
MALPQTLKPNLGEKEGKGKKRRGISRVKQEGEGKK